RGQVFQFSYLRYPFFSHNSPLPKPIFLGLEFLERRKILTSHSMRSKTQIKSIEEI
ncbi:hypothetical protein GIB67_025775, partial [Kingdonia uniflora]